MVDILSTVAELTSRIVLYLIFQQAFTLSLVCPIQLWTQIPYKQNTANYLHKIFSIPLKHRNMELVDSTTNN